eukprot:1362675-Amorphochlora_amoeboformis.AAC.1
MDTFEKIPAKSPTIDFSFDRRTNKWCLTSKSKYCSTPHGDVDHPLDIDWLSERAFDIRFSIVPIGPMKGEGMTGSMSPLSPGSSQEPKKPTLIKFMTDDPEYDEGCKFIREENFIMAEQQFGNSHPCMQVATATWKVNSKKDRGPGMTVDDAKNCGQRAIKRLWDTARVGYGFDTASESAKFLVDMIARSHCAYLPETQ